MALFLVVLGGAAAVEVHRAITGNGGNKDVQELKQKEETLRRQLQVIQRELQTAKEARELTSEEAANLAAINQQLQQDKDVLAQESSALKAENEELVERAERLLERQQLLESCTESLKLENGLLIQQFDRLKLKYEHESSAFQAQLADLKERVSTSLQRFTAGDITAQQLIAFLADMGVELRCPEAQVAQLPQRLAQATNEEERVQALDQVELKVEETWLERMKLASSSPSRATRLLMSGAAFREAAAPVPALEAATAPHAEQRRLVTPRSLEAAAAATAAAKLSSHAVEAGSPQAEDTIRAVHVSPVKAAPALLASEDAPLGTTEEGGEADKAVAAKGRSLLFRPAKRAVKKVQQALLEVDVPFTTAGSPVPRLPFDAMTHGDDMEMGGRSGSLVAL